MLTKEEIADLKNTWKALMTYCSWDDFPPNLLAKVKRAEDLIEKLEPKP